MAPKKYIKNDDGNLELNPEYRDWMSNIRTGTKADVVIATPIADTYNYEEEGATAEEEGEEEEEERRKKDPNYGLGSSEIIKGSYRVPEGVAVEMIKNFNGKKNLLNDCPKDVRKLLEAKGAFRVYDRFVQSIYDDKNTRNALGRWKDVEFTYRVDVFEDEFADKGIRVVLCKRQSGNGSVRWLEYIDVDVVGNYVPQFDLSNMSGQVIKTAYCTLQFPNGVTVEELKQWSGREKLKGRIPYEVEKMLTKHDLLEEYHVLVSDFVSSANGSNFFKNWDIEKLKDLVDRHDPIFEAKGVDLFVSHKQEYISHGNAGGHYEYFRWIEFVDRDLQPNYVPQRDAETKDQTCSIM